MAKLVGSHFDNYRSWLGMKWVCPHTGNTWELETSDLSQLATISTGPAYNPDNSPAIPCPCGRGHITFESDQYEGRYLSHH